MPPKVYFKGGCLEVALRDLKGKQRAFIVTDKPLFDMGYVDQVRRVGGGGQRGLGAALCVSMNVHVGK